MANWWTVFIPRRITASRIETNGRPPAAALLARRNRRLESAGSLCTTLATSSAVASSRRLISMIANATPFGLGSWPLIRSCSRLTMIVVGYPPFTFAEGAF